MLLPSVFCKGWCEEQRSQNTDPRKHIVSPAVPPHCVPGEGLKSQLWSRSAVSPSHGTHAGSLWRAQRWPVLTSIPQRNVSGSSAGVPQLGSFPKTDVAVNIQVSWTEKCPADRPAGVRANGSSVEEILSSLNWQGRLWTAAWETSPPTSLKMQVVFWILPYGQDPDAVSGILLHCVNQRSSAFLSWDVLWLYWRVPLLGPQTCSVRNTEINGKLWCRQSSSTGSCQRKASGILLIHFLFIFLLLPH